MTITKQQELAILDDAIEALGPHSYLGPWLKEVKWEVEQAIKSDFFPEVTLKAAYQRGAAIHATAVEQAEILARRQREAIEASDRAILAAKVEAGRALALASQQVQQLATRLAANR